jgi:hypothetical protein
MATCLCPTCEVSHHFEPDPVLEYYSSTYTSSPDLYRTIRGPTSSCRPKKPDCTLIWVFGPKPLVSHLGKHKTQQSNSTIGWRTRQNTALWAQRCKRGARVREGWRGLSTWQLPVDLIYGIVCFCCGIPVERRVHIEMPPMST